MKKLIVGVVTVTLLIIQSTLVLGAEKVVVIPLGSNIAGSKSYVWISGNGVQPFHQSDTTIIDMMNNGGAKIYQGKIQAKKMNATRYHFRSFSRLSSDRYRTGYLLEG